MQEQSQTSRNSTHADLRDLPGMSITDILRDMPIGTVESGYKVELEQAPNVRTMISTFHRLTSQRFKTAKTKGGILVWRTA